MNYELKTGVVFGENFLDQDEFKEYLKNLLQSEGISDKFLKFSLKLSTVLKRVRIQKNKKSITEFLSDLDEIYQDFLEISTLPKYGVLGGDIHLFTTFNFGDKKDQMQMFLMNEKDLPSYIDGYEGARVYSNTLDNLKKMLKDGKSIQLTDELLKRHLKQYERQLHTTSIYKKTDYESLQGWAFNNLKERYKAVNKNNKQQFVTLGRYFWGNNLHHGYIMESFGTHLGLIHPNVLDKMYVSQTFNKSVIEEHGGAGSEELFELLKSSKGNTFSQLSGDTVIVESNGKIKFNFQTKASLSSSYEFMITYQNFLNNVLLLRDFVMKMNSLTLDKISDRDVKILFNKFSMQAWVPIVQKNEQLINDTIDWQSQHPRYSLHEGLQANRMNERCHAHLPT